jgi:hypothetical protein
MGGCTGDQVVARAAHPLTYRARQVAQLPWLPSDVND